VRAPLSWAKKKAIARLIPYISEKNSVMIFVVSLTVTIPKQLQVDKKNMWLIFVLTG
jgi:hypothetical protein